MIRLLVVLEHDVLEVRFGEQQVVEFVVEARTPTRESGEPENTPLTCRPRTSNPSSSGCWARALPVEDRPGTTP